MFFTASQFFRIRVVNVQSLPDSYLFLFLLLFYILRFLPGKNLMPECLVGWFPVSQSLKFNSSRVLSPHFCDLSLTQVDTY